MKIDWKICFRVGLSIFLLYLCIHYWSAAARLLGLVVRAATPLLIGCMVAYVVNILMSCYERHWFLKAVSGPLAKSRRPACMAGAYLTLVAMIALVIWLIVPKLGACIQLVLAELPNALRFVVDAMERFQVLPERLLAPLAQVDWNSAISQLVKFLGSGMGSVVDVVVSTVTSVFSGIVTGLLSVIFSFYLLGSKETLGRQCDRTVRRYLKEKHYFTLRRILAVLDRCFHSYIVGQCVEALILGILCTVGMLLLGLPYATMIGALIAFTALIPIAGAYIGAGVGAFMILTVSPVQALIFLVFLVILQQLEGNLIYPRVVGSSIGLPGIWVLAAVTVGGGMLGVLGMLLGVPLAAALYRLLRDDVNKQPLEESPTEAAENKEIQSN